MDEKVFRNSPAATADEDCPLHYFHCSHRIPPSIVAVVSGHRKRK
jgi:hypothetical protein